MATVAERRRRRLLRRSSWTTGRDLVVTPPESLERTPPGAPPDSPIGDRPTAEGPDDSSIATVREMTQGAINLQFNISERIDTKIRTYAGFASTAFAVAQAIVLKNDVHTKLGTTASGVIPYLAGIGALALLVSLVMAVVSLRTRTEFDLDDHKLRDLLTRGYKGDAKAGSEGVNLLIGELARRQGRNEDRVKDLNWVIIASVVAVILAFVEIAVAVVAVA